MSTWLNDNDGDSFLKNYAIYSQNRSDGYGGAALLFKNNVHIEVIKLPDLKPVQVIAAKTTNLPLNMIFLSVYVPAKNKKLDESLVLKNLKKLADLTKDFESLIIGGDFNAFHRSWGSSYNCPRGQLLCEEFDRLINLNDGSPTRIRSSNQVSNPLDCTWIAPELYGSITWEVEKENMG